MKNNRSSEFGKKKSIQKGKEIAKFKRREREEKKLLSFKEEREREGAVEMSC